VLVIRTLQEYFLIAKSAYDFALCILDLEFLVRLTHRFDDSGSFYEFVVGAGQWRARELSRTSTDTLPRPINRG
jgi:hypothetical protein